MLHQEPMMQRESQYSVGLSRELGEGEYTSSQSSADTHIYYVFQNQLELEKNIEKIKI